MTEVLSNFDIAFAMGSPKDKCVENVGYDFPR
jgi:hypothetical protein